MLKVAKPTTDHVFINVVLPSIGALHRNNRCDYAFHDKGIRYDTYITMTVRAFYDRSGIKMFDQSSK